jgi:hypothetical protein
LVGLAGENGLAGQVGGVAGDGVVFVFAGDGAEGRPLPPGGQ